MQRTELNETESTDVMVKILTNLNKKKNDETDRCKERPIMDETSIQKQNSTKMNRKVYNKKHCKIVKPE